MAKIKTFPIPTTDRKVSESNEGLMPALCADVNMSSPSTSAVVSEYGIRKAFDDHLGSLVSGHNIGMGEGVFESVSSNNVRLKSISTQYPNRVHLTTTSGVIQLNYDGRAQSVTPTVTSFYVQGGSQQLYGTFDSWKLKVFAIMNLINSNTPHLSNVYKSTVNGGSLVYSGFDSPYDEFREASTVMRGAAGNWNGIHELPLPVGKTINDIKQIEYCASYLYVVFSNGDLYVQGWNRNGVLGLGHQDRVYSLTLSNTNVRSVHLGSRGFNTGSYPEHNNMSVIIVKTDGSLWTCGNNNQGQLGIGSTTNPITSWTQIPGITNPIAVYPAVKTNSYATAAFIIDAQGKVWACGYNRYGHLGIGYATTTSPYLETSFKQVGGLLNNEFVTKLAIGHIYNPTVLALTKSGKVFGWGGNIYGALAKGHHQFNANTAPEKSPILIYNPNDVPYYPEYFNDNTVKTTTKYNSSYA